MMLVECTRACPPGRRLALRARVIGIDANGPDVQNGNRRASASLSPRAFACSSYYYAVAWIEPTYSSEAGLGRWSHRLRGACEQAARLAVCSRPDARLAEDEEPGFPAVSAQVQPAHS